jgi:hypothetical protein
MTSEEMERAIESLLHNQAKNTSDIMLTNEVVNKLAEAVAQDQVENRALLEAYRTETREAVNNLIIANEVTRELAERVAKLAITTSQRVTALESN